MNYIKKVLIILKKKKYVVIGIIILLFVIGILFINNKKVNEETITVAHTDFINQVSISGKVVASQSVDLGFKSVGLIERTYAQVGAFVKKGQIIANLDSSDVRGALNVAKANYEKVLNGATSTDIDVAKAAVATAQVSLNQLEIQQDLAVKNAKKKLLNSGFIATTQDQLSNQIPPIISGTYLKDVEGQITLTVYGSSGGNSFQTSGLTSATGIASTEVPQAIGDTGLYIKFFNTADRTKWIIDIPNKQSANYLENSNAYQQALSNQIQTIANAKAILNQAESTLLSRKAASRPEDVASLYGSLLIAEGAYNDKFIYAPFDGQITKMDAKVGEIVSPNTSLISMMSNDTFQIESYVPEVNISKIKLNDEASVTLDAYGESVFFKAKVVLIDPAETIKDGVSTYKTRLQFMDVDNRIKSGMTANVSINTFNKKNTIVVPGGVIFIKNGKNFVQVKNDKKIEERNVVLGSVSSLGQTEILSGLSDGELIILNPIVK